MTLEGKRIGFGITGSFCTYDKAFLQIQRLVDEKAKVQTIFSENGSTIDSRFGKGEDFLKRAEEITGVIPVTTIEGTEPIGPQALLDVLLICPCTGNTLAKLAAGITDTSVLMAAKAHLRNERPVVISLSTNDALSMNMKNIGQLLNMKNIYFVTFGQDDPEKKPRSMTADMDFLIPALEMALEGRQVQPIIKSPIL